MFQLGARFSFLRKLDTNDLFIGYLLLNETLSKAWFVRVACVKAIETIRDSTLKRITE